MKKLSIKNHIPFGLATLVLLAIDLISKYFILHKNFEEIKIIKGFFHITFYANKGVAFGMFFGYYLQILISSSIILLLIHFGWNFIQEKKSFINKILLGIIIGGAIGNLINRIQLGYVVDFIYLNPLPVFNIADIGITVGIIILLITNWKSDKKLRF